MGEMPCKKRRRVGPVLCYTAAELNMDPSRNANAKISFGCKKLDSRFGGGIPLVGITEIAGEAGCGKTQFCLQLALQAHLPQEHGGCNGRSLYLSCGEGQVPFGRLRQLARAYEKKYEISEESFLDSVLTLKVNNVEEQLQVVLKDLDQLVPSRNLKLVIIDSIAGLMRTDFSTNIKQDRIDKYEATFLLGQKMKKLSSKYNVPFLVANQVSADFSQGGASAARGQTANKAALGLTWAACVTARYMLSKREQGSFLGPGLDYRGDGNQNPNAQASLTTVDQLKKSYHQQPLKGTKRFISLKFAPHLPRCTTEYFIEAEGIRSAF